MSSDMSTMVQAISSLVVALMAAAKFWLDLKFERRRSSENSSKSASKPRSALRKINIAFLCWLLSLINVYSYVFGPEKSLPLTNGTVANLTGALIMFMLGCGLMWLEN